MILRLILILLIFSCCKKEENFNKRPNILFIMLDDLGKEWISGYGASKIKTPSIDKLISTGLSFKNVYSMPQCTPTRVTLLTGQYPWRHGWINHFDVPRWGHGARFDPNLNPSFPKMLRNAGYSTCAAGKWQINDFRLEPDAMVKAGFDEYCMWTGGEGGNIKLSDNRYWDPYIHTKSGSKVYKNKFGEDIFTDFIIDFMKKNKEKPMMIYYPMCLPHGPLTSTPLEPNAPKSEQHKSMVRYTDHILNVLVKALDEIGIRKNTIIIWTTDNGTSGSIVGDLNGKMVRGGKSMLSENGVNAPFVINAPGIVPKGITSHALIDFSDLLPTLCDLAQISPDKNYEYDGISFAPEIFGLENANLFKEKLSSETGLLSGVIILFIAGFTPLPFKIITISSGFVHFNILLFIITCFISRGLRFFLVAYLSYKYGAAIRPMLEKKGTQWSIIITGVVLLITLGIYFINK